MMRNRYVDAVNELLADNKNAWKIPHEHNVIKYWLEMPDYYLNAENVCRNTNDFLLTQIKLEKGQQWYISDYLESWLQGV